MNIILTCRENRQATSSSLPVGLLQNDLRNHIRNYVQLSKTKSKLPITSYLVRTNATERLQCSLFVSCVRHVVKTALPFSGMYPAGNFGNLALPTDVSSCFPWSPVSSLNLDTLALKFTDTSSTLLPRKRDRHAPFDVSSLRKRLRGFKFQRPSWSNQSLVSFPYCLEASLN